MKDRLDVLKSVGPNLVELTEDFGSFSKGDYFRYCDLRKVVRVCPGCRSENLKGITCQDCGHKYFIWGVRTTDEFLKGDIKNEV